MRAGNSVRQALLGVVMLGSLGLSHEVLAHKLNVFAYAEGDTVSVEGYFADGRKAQNTAIKVLDGSGKVLVEGTTDGQGKFVFKVPQKSDLKIVLNAGMGHKGELMLSAAELEEGATSAVDHPAGDHEAGHGDGGSAAATYAGSELDAAVHRAVGEAIKPLVRELAESRQQASISELLGAVGYIFGLLGVFAYYKARQASKKGEAPPAP